MVIESPTDSKEIHIILLKSLFLFSVFPFIVMKKRNRSPFLNRIYTIVYNELVTMYFGITHSDLFKNKNRIIIWILLLNMQSIELKIQQYFI